MIQSNYVMAGFETYQSILNNFILNKTNEFNDNFTRENLSNFHTKSCNRFLHSFGQNFRNKKSYKNYNKQEANIFTICRESRIFDHSEFFVDSGGFQASIGLIDKKGIKILSDLYYDFLIEHFEVYDKAFVLDIPPGPGCNIFDNFDQVYDMNLESYERARNLPKHVRDKIVYIHHFRTPKLWEIYTDILEKEDMFDSFNHFATGGVVANQKSDSAIPVIIYILPLIPLLKQAIKFKRKELRFHVLGGAGFRDILFYELFTKIIKEKYNIELLITYDSSGLFKGLMVGRFTYILDEEDQIVRKLDLRTNSLNKRYKRDITVHDMFKDAVNNVAIEYGFKQINMDKIYNPETGTFYDSIRVYAMIQLLTMYSKIQEFLRNKVKDLYEFYKNDDLIEFNQGIESITRSLNQGKITRKQISKSYSVITSLKMLEDLDEDYCKYIVNKYLAKDEFNYLIQNEKILTF